MNYYREQKNIENPVVHVFFWCFFFFIKACVQLPSTFKILLKPLLCGKNINVDMDQEQ